MRPAARGDAPAAAAGAPSWWRLTRAFGPDLWTHRKLLLIAYGSSLLAVAATLLSPWPLKLIIDHVVAGEPLPGSLSRFAGQLSPAVLVGLLAAAAALFAALQVSFSAAGQNLNARVRERMGLALRDRVLVHIQALPATLGIRHRRGELMLRLMDDTHFVVRLLAKNVPVVFQHLVTTLSILAVMFFLEPRLGCVGLAVLLALGWLARRSASRLRRASASKRQREGEVAGLAQEILRGLHTVQALGSEETMRRWFEDTNMRSLRAGVEEARAAVAMERGLGVAKSLAVALIVGIGALLVLRGQLTVGSLTVYVAYITQLVKPVEKINVLASAVTRGLARSEKLLDLLGEPPAVRDLPGAIDPGSLRDRLELRSVSFWYPPAEPGEAPVPVLKDVSLVVEPGSLTVLTGPSGAGKSTLFSLFLRFYDPLSGELRIDGIPYSRILWRRLRAQFSVMPQDTHLFAGTLRSALAPGDREASEEELWEALGQVALEDFVRRLPGRLDAPLGEEGVNLSGGQRARVSLARALLLNRPVLLLDEPFANVDDESQRIILRALSAIRGRRTVLAISHQPNLVAAADVVLQLADCRLTRLTPAAVGGGKVLPLRTPH